MIATGALSNITEEQTVELFKLSFRDPEGNMGTVKLFLDAGLNLNARSNGKTVIEIAKKWADQDNEKKPLLELLKNAAANAEKNRR